LILDYNVLFSAPTLKKNSNMRCAKTLFIISLDNVNSMDKKLRSIVYKLNKTFSNCDFIIGDTLNRFNFMMKDNLILESMAEKLALDAGDKWLNNNKHVLEELTIPYKIIRWNTWRENKNFNDKLKIVENEYNINAVYQEFIHKAATKFLSRNNISNSIDTYCIKYLLEECAAMLLWADLGYQFELYTSKRNPAMEITYKVLIEDKYPKDILLPVIVDVKHKTKKEHEIIALAFNQILNLDYGHIYVKDETGIYLYCNISQAKSLGVEVKDIIGKTDYDFFVKEEADKYKTFDDEIIKAGKTIVVEESWLYNNESRIFQSIKYPLVGNDDKIIGILGISIDVTAEKQVTKLHTENEKYKLQNLANEAIAKEHERFNRFIDDIQRNIRAYQSSLLNSKINNDYDLINKNLPQIKLTKREQEVLYFVALNKSPKEIAKIISTPIVN
jgi:PAS domain S-box-containing protein